MSFFSENQQALKDFVRMSQAVGARADYVQGGGGNTSVKFPDGKMAIKASGFKLSDIQESEAYAVLDAAALREFYNAHEASEFEDVEKAGSERAKELIVAVEGLKALRPSVEAGFHSILDTFVAHSHSVYANLAACSANAREIVAEIAKDTPYAIGFVPYTNPGAKLTFSIRDEIRAVERATGKKPSVIFMQNHGVIATHADADECVRIHDDINAREGLSENRTERQFLRYEGPQGTPGQRPLWRRRAAQKSAVSRSDGVLCRYAVPHRRSARAGQGFAQERRHRGIQHGCGQSRCNRRNAGGHCVYYRRH